MKHYCLLCGSENFSSNANIENGVCKMRGLCIPHVSHHIVPKNTIALTPIKKGIKIFIEGLEKANIKVLRVVTVSKENVVCVKVTSDKGHFSYTATVIFGSLSFAVIKYGINDNEISHIISNLTSDREYFFEQLKTAVVYIIVNTAPTNVQTVLKEG